MQTGNQKIITKAQASFTELLDNREAIILDLDNLHYYTLNAAGILLWKHLRSESAQTATDLSAVLAAAFHLSPEHADLDTVAWLDEMSRNGLISYHAPHTHPPARPLPTPADLPPYEAPHLKLANSLAGVVLSGSAIVGPSAITGTP
jgi:hypothetical protein